MSLNESVLSERSKLLALADILISKDIQFEAIVLSEDLLNEIAFRLVSMMVKFNGHSLNGHSLNGHNQGVYVSQDGIRLKPGFRIAVILRGTNVSLYSQDVSKDNKWCIRINGPSNKNFFDGHDLKAIFE